MNSRRKCEKTKYFRNEEQSTRCHDAETGLGRASETGKQGAGEELPWRTGECRGGGGDGRPAEKAGPVVESSRKTRPRVPARSRKRSVAGGGGGAGAPGDAGTRETIAHVTADCFKDEPRACRRGDGAACVAREFVVRLFKTDT